MTDIAVYQPSGAALAVPEPHDIDSWIAVASDVIKIAKVIHDTPFVPEGLRGSEPAVAAAILAGRELGIGPMTALQHIHVIKGKPAQSAALMRALIQSAGHQIETVDISDTRAVVKGRRKGESSWEEAAFTADQAKRAGIDLGKYPQDKLYARATSRLARRKFADVIAGMPYSAEDLEDGQADEGTIPEAASNGHAPAAAPRTAQRRQRAARPDPTPASGAASASTSGATQQAAPGQAAPPARTGDGLPPLPGEEDEPGPTPPGPSSAAQDRPQQETSPRSASSPGSSEPAEHDYDSPGTINPGQITAIWTIFTNVYQFTKDEKDQARAVCAHVIGHELDSTRDMSRNEARTVLDTLSNWRETAEQNGITAREFLLELLAMAAASGQDGEPGE